MEREFLVRGFTTLRGVLGPDDVARFLRQLQDELSQPVDAALLRDAVSDTSAVRLDDAATWPTGGGRRVMECAPAARGAHWPALRSAPVLVSALDALLGTGCWELPFNGDDECTQRHECWSGGPVRFWYFPIVFPEGTYPAASPPEPPLAPAAARRPIVLQSWRDERPLQVEAVDAPARWQPVNRRRVRGKGWHIDSGPGFPNDALRHANGHPFQAVVLLLLLTDCEPGGGGTVMLAGSHKVVEEELRRNPGGITHQALNEWCVKRTLDDIRAGALCISSDGDGVGVAEQVVGKAGDVVLMHPLLFHSGSTNLRSRVRIMGNGMVRLKHEAFEARGGLRFISVE